MQLLIREPHQLTVAEREACRSLWRRTWPPSPGEVRDPDDPDEMHAVVVLVLLVDDTQTTEQPALVGACQWEDRTIAVAGQPQRIAGLGGVVVEAAYRGQGLGVRLIEAATAEVRRRGFEFGALFCGEHRRTFYERFGWRLLEGRITKTRLRQACAIDPADLVMALALTPEAREQLPAWIHAPIHVGVGQW